MAKTGNEKRKALIFQEKIKKSAKKLRSRKFGRKKDGETEVSTKKPETIIKQLRKTMLADLKARGLTDPIYMDMVEEYLELWDRRRLLAEDVKARGVSVIDGVRGGRTENRSIGLGLQVSKQMLSIYTALGFCDRAKAAMPGGEEDDEL